LNFLFIIAFKDYYKFDGLVSKFKLSAFNDRLPN